MFYPEILLLLSCFCSSRADEAFSSFDSRVVFILLRFCLYKVSNFFILFLCFFFSFLVWNMKFLSFLLYIMDNYLFAEKTLPFIWCSISSFLLLASSSLSCWSLSCNCFTFSSCFWISLTASWTFLFFSASYDCCLAKLGA